MSRWITTPPKPLPPDVAEARRTVAAGLAEQVSITVTPRVVLADVPSRYVAMLAACFPIPRCATPPVARRVPGAGFRHELGSRERQNTHRVSPQPEQDVEEQPAAA